MDGATLKNKTNEIVEILETKVGEVDTRYRNGPSLHFYRRVIDVRRKTSRVKDFLTSESNLELLYATLVSWDMNSRGAKMLDFSDFCARIKDNTQLFENIEAVGSDITAIDFKKLRIPLLRLYEGLHLMATGSKLVSNSKFLHFVFPDLLVPMDGTNTLNYIYGNTGESSKKYIELSELFFQIANTTKAESLPVNRTGWNSSLAKMIDNAVLIAMDVSLKSKNGIGR